MNTIFLTLISLGIVCVVLAIINREAVGRMFSAGRAQVGNAGRWAVEQDPVAMMQQGVDDSYTIIRKSKAALEKCQSSMTGLERQVKSGSTEEARLLARIKQAQSEGKTDDDPVLVQLAVSLKRIREENKTNKEQLESQHGIYNDMLQQMQNAQRRAESLEQEAQRLGGQLQMSKLNAELADFTQQFDSSGVHQGLDNVSKYRDIIQRQIDQNNAKLKVNKDMSGGNNGREVKQWEDNADARDILAELRSNGK